MRDFRGKRNGGEGRDAGGGGSGSGGGPALPQSAAGQRLMPLRRQRDLRRFLGRLHPARWSARGFRARRQTFRALRDQGFGLGVSLALARRDRAGSTWLRLAGPMLLARAQAAAGRAGVTPIVLWGTLLGHRREGGFLPHDHDIDLAITPEDVPRLDAFLDELALACLAVDFVNPYLFRIRFPGLPQLWIDIWVLHPESGDWFVAVRFHGDRPDVLVYRFPQHLLMPLVQIELAGVGMAAPTQADRLLALFYGDWRIPRPDFGPLDSPTVALLPEPPAVPLLLAGRPWPPDWR